MFGIDFGYTTFAFLIFFAVVVILYWLTPRKYRYITLLIASLAFYALLSWQSLFFIAGTIVSMYFFARAISKNASESKAYIQEHKGEMSLDEKKAYKEKNRKIRKRYMVLAVVINLLMLGVMKYTDFMIGNINGIIHWFNPNFSFAFLHLFLPLGISFYVFQAIAYIVDVYWGKIEAEANFAKFALFLCYFPKVMQGPIVRYDEMKEALFGEHVFDYDTFAMGLIRAAWGYFKKLVIADTLITFIKFGFGYVDELSNIEAFLVILFYFIQDYCDFSGYMDISIGISQSMGVKLPENFARPYLSRGIDEYWRRWHMTLGAWFKDYVFYPLSISKLSLNIGRASKKVMPEFGKKIPAVFGLIIVWFLTGLWHGASWNYVLWGLYYGAIIILSVAFDPLIKKSMNVIYDEMGNTIKDIPEEYENLISKVFMLVFIHFPEEDVGIGNSWSFDTPKSGISWTYTISSISKKKVEVSFVGIMKTDNMSGVIEGSASIHPTMGVVTKSNSKSTISMTDASGNNSSVVINTTISVKE